MRETRRGDPEARTSLGRPIIVASVGYEDCLNRWARRGLRKSSIISNEQRGAPGTGDFGRKLAKSATDNNRSRLRGGGRRESCQNAIRQLVANRAIGADALIAVAFDGGRVGRGPIFYGRRNPVCERDRLVVRLRGERDDDVEAQSFEILQVLESHRFVRRDIDP